MTTSTTNYSVSNYMGIKTLNFVYFFVFYYRYYVHIVIFAWLVCGAAALLLHVIDVR